MVFSIFSARWYFGVRWKRKKKRFPENTPIFSTRHRPRRIGWSWFSRGVLRAAFTVSFPFSHPSFISRRREARVARDPGVNVFSLSFDFRSAIPSCAEVRHDTLMKLARLDRQMNKLQVQTLLNFDHYVGDYLDKSGTHSFVAKGDKSFKRFVSP